MVAISRTGLRGGKRNFHQAPTLGNVCRVGGTQERIRLVRTDYARERKKRGEGSEEGVYWSAQPEWGAKEG